MTTTDVRPRVEPDRVHGSLYTDPAIYAAELERIWYRGWVFVGHESEVPEPNDYVRKWIGPQPIVMTRSADGNVNLLVNRCSHRGNLVCDRARGNTSAFRCSSATAALRNRSRRYWGLVRLHAGKAASAAATAARASSGSAAATLYKTFSVKGEVRS